MWEKMQSSGAERAGQRRVSYREAGGPVGWLWLKVPAAVLLDPHLEGNHQPPVSCPLAWTCTLWHTRTVSKKEKKLSVGRGGLLEQKCKELTDSGF